MKALWRIGILGLVIAAASCSRKPEDETVINTMLAVIDENVAAMQRRDLEGVMATIHPDSPLYAETRNAMTQIVNLPVAFDFEQIEVVAANDTEARVDYVQVTRATSDEIGFRANRLRGTHVLRPDSGVWKIYDTRIHEIKYLDDNSG